MTIDEAIYCMKSYLPGNEIEDCLNCPYYGDDLISHCRSSDAHKLAIMALEEMKEKKRKQRNMKDVDVIYICKGEGMTCFLHPGCIYREDPVSSTDWVCNHTMDPECAKYGACEDPENHPERFTFQERGDTCVPSYYWEEEPK